MDIHNLVHMANQIGSFFASNPDPAEASGEIANHLKRYWAPRMRIQLLDYVDQDKGEGLSPEALAAILAHRGLLDPRTPAA